MSTFCKANLTLQTFHMINFFITYFTFLCSIFRMDRFCKEVFSCWIFWSDWLTFGKNVQIEQWTYLSMIRKIIEKIQKYTGAKKISNLKLNAFSKINTSHNSSCKRTSWRVQSFDDCNSRLKPNMHNDCSK